MTQQQIPTPTPIIPYVDTFNVTLGPYGAMFIFGAGSAVDPRTQQQSTHIAAHIGMSHEHLKVLAFLVYREVMNHEARFGVMTQLPAVVITQLVHPFPQAPGMPPPPQVAVEAWVKSMESLALKEWNEFWQGKKDPPQAVNPNGASEAAVPVPLPG